MKFLSKCYIGLIFFLLYIPIAVLIVFSFNSSGSFSTLIGSVLQLVLPKLQPGQG